MADSKVVINLATGHGGRRARDGRVPRRRRGRRSSGKNGGDVPDEGGRAARAARLRGGVACDGLPAARPRSSSSIAEGGGELLVCPICFNARKLDEGELVGEREARRRDAALGVDRRRAATVFSY